MRYVKVCALVSMLFLVGCWKDHSVATQFVQSATVGEVVYDKSIENNSVFITCEGTISRLVIVLRDEFGSLNIRSIHHLSPRVRCDPAQASDLGDQKK